MAGISLTAEVDAEAIAKLGDVGRRAISMALELMATEAWGNIARESPVDHGRLAGSFQLFHVSDNEYRISSEVIYASYVNEGTGPHEIVPTNAQALYWPGADHPVKRVNHPGTEANPFVDRALEGAGSRAAEFAERAVREAMA